MRRAPAAVTLLLFLAAGCGSDGIPVNSPSSPLAAGAGGIQECIPDPSLTSMSEGATILDNRSKGTATVEHVSLYGAHHIRSFQAVVVPIRNTALGDVPWPPVGAFLREDGIQWNKRVPAAGARVPPSSNHSSRNVVIEIRPTARKATYAGVQVRYRENGQQYELRTNIKTVLVPNTRVDC